MIKTIEETGVKIRITDPKLSNMGDVFDATRIVEAYSSEPRDFQQYDEYQTIIGYRIIEGLGLQDNTDPNSPRTRKFYQVISPKSVEEI